MINQANNVSITSNPLPPDEMRIFVLQLISYEQLVSDIAAGTIRGSITQLDRIVNVIVELQYETGTMTIGSFGLSIEAVSHRLLQAKYYDIELTLRDMAISHIETDQQLVQTLYNTIGSLRSYQYRQRRESKHRLHPTN